MAGDVANLFMCWWNKEFLRSVASHGIKLQLYSRYVDDIEIAAVKPNESSTDETTMLRLQEIANEIHPSIQITIDFPSNHPNNRMPVLDIEQWIQQVDVNGEMKNQILHTHYMKNMARPTLNQPCRFIQRKTS